MGALDASAYSDDFVIASHFMKKFCNPTRAETTSSTLPEFSSKQHPNTTHASAATWGDSVLPPVRARSAMAGRCPGDDKNASTAALHSYSHTIKSRKRTDCSFSTFSLSSSRSCVTASWRTQRGSNSSDAFERELSGSKFTRSALSLL